MVNYKSVKIGDKQIYNFGKPYIIAEIGANHNGSIKLAKKLIKQARSVGADSAKFQSWSKKNLFSKNIYESNPELERQLDAWSLNYIQFIELKKTCDKEDITFSCTPISKEDVDFLVEELGVDFIKVASMDLNNLPFLKYIASKHKPIILSTGLGSFEEIQKAVETITSKNDNLILLHCISAYPPKIDHINLNNIDMLRDEFRLPVGFSDHYPDETFSLAAVAKGASVIERHFTLDKKMSGWDHSISSDENGMKNLVKNAELINRSLGSYNRIIYDNEKKQKESFRRSAVAKKNLRKGDIIKEEDIVFKRPGEGIPPNQINEIIGKRITKNITKDSILSFKYIELQ
jgi:sialic acid synthase SpsE